jgi:uncharacterized protein (DUF2252 family)
MSNNPVHAERLAALETKRTLKMARSAHAYVRGNTAQFYDWLAESPAARRLPEGPAIWICGDCHLGNLGPIANGSGKVEIQIRDLDQAVIGNPLHDLIRLGLSLATAARGSDLPGVTTARMIEQMVAGYEAALSDPTSGDAGPEPDAVRTVRRRALGRRWRHLAVERLEDVQPAIPLGKKFLELGSKERRAVAAIFEEPDVARMILSLSHHEGEHAVRMTDAAYWIKGCSSLGLMRVAAIVETSDDDGELAHALVDIKQAVEPIAPAVSGARMPSEPGERVVAAARALSPYLGERIAAARVLGKSVFVRELMPQDLKLEVDQFTTAQAIKAAHYLAFVVGKAHARQIGVEDRRAWCAELRHSLGGQIDAPSWLWDSVVELAGRHEAGYLEHCRQYAMAAA